MNTVGFYYWDKFDNLIENILPSNYNDKVNMV